MSDFDVRILMAILAVALTFTHALWTGIEWLRSSLPVTIGRTGLTGLFLYVLAGQIKAIRLGIPVDGYTWLGLAALGLGAAGFGWEVVARHRRRGD